jgi:hypothetical protein
MRKRFIFSTMVSKPYSKNSVLIIIIRDLSNPND